MSFKGRLGVYNSFSQSRLPIRQQDAGTDANFPEIMDITVEAATYNDGVEVQDKSLHVYEFTFYLLYIVCLHYILESLIL